MLQQVTFAVLGAVTLGAAVMVVTSHNLLRCALWLVLSFFGIAGLFVLMQAEFLAVVQVLVYIGAISTLIIFAVMLSRNYMDPEEPRFNSQWGAVAGFAALLFVGLAAVLTRVAWPVAAGSVPADAINQLGIYLVTTFAVPFEVASVLLVVAMIGAIIIAREKRVVGAMVPLTYYLLLAAGLFCVGIYGALARRNAVAVLMGVELMLNAVNINLVAFWRYSDIVQLTGQAFAIVVITVAAAEAAVGLALIIAIYRQRHTVNVEELDSMKG